MLAKGIHPIVREKHLLCEVVLEMFVGRLCELRCSWDLMILMLMCAGKDF